MQSDWLKFALKISAALWIGGVVLAEVWKRNQPGSLDAMNLRAIADIFAGLALILVVLVAIRTAWRGRETSGQVDAVRSHTGLLDRPWKRLAFVGLCAPLAAFLVAVMASAYYYVQLQNGGDDYMLLTCHREQAWRDLGLNEAPNLFRFEPKFDLNPDYTRVSALAGERHSERWKADVVRIEGRALFQSCMAQGRNHIGFRWAVDHAANIALWTGGLMLAFFLGRAILHAMLALFKWIMMRGNL